MKIAIFGGSFDPVHNEHVAAVRAAIAQLSLDRVYIVPSHIAPHKHGGARADGAARLSMCKIAFSAIPQAVVDDIEIAGGGTSYTYRTCRAFRERFPDAELYFLVGADMLEDFFTWKNPDEILSYVTLAAFGRGGAGVEDLHRKFRARFGKDYIEIGFCGKSVSSTEIRVRLAFGKRAEDLNEAVAAYISERGLYRHPAVAPALALEKEDRREHSFRVALMAAKRARGLCLSEEKATLAAALHDCAKYVPQDSPLLKGFHLPENVPPPVLHQFTGAYLAEHEFGITDEEVLNAVKYHTSGRANMSALEKLIFLADMLEEGRSYPGVDVLRNLFYTDLDECLLHSLERQITYLQSCGNAIYPLTMQAYEWAKSQK